MYNQPSSYKHITHKLYHWITQQTIPKTLNHENKNRVEMNNCKSEGINYLEYNFLIVFSDF